MSDSSIKKLRNTFESEIVNLRELTDKFPIHEKSAYAQWLAQTYYFVCHSTRLLALTSSRLPRNYNDLHYRFVDHVREERGHEILALRDLEKLGENINDIQELPETQAFYQSQYYWIEHVNPLSFFGYILCLEGFATSGSKLYQEVVKKYGEKPASFMKVHAQEDEGHVEKALQSLELLNTEDHQAITQNLILSCCLYSNIYRAIEAKTRSEKQSKLIKKAA